MRNLAFFLILAFIFGCGKTQDDKVFDVVLSANIALSKGDCQSAINLLEGFGRENESKIYLKALSSAYACRAGYSTVTLFASDISKIANVAPLGGLATFTTSTVQAQNPLQFDPKFKDLQEAIDILLYAGGIPSTTEPTTAERKKHFTDAEVSEIDSQLLFMVLAQLGKFLYVYGDSSATGVKGGGTALNNCFTDYSNIDGGAAGAISGILSGQLGACKVKTSSHLQLDSTQTTAATRKTRLCHGVVLLNSLFALFPNVVSSIFSNPTEAATINLILSGITDAKSNLKIAYPAIGQVVNTQSQTNCEDDSIVTIRSLESYYATLFEFIMN